MDIVGSEMSVSGRRSGSMNTRRRHMNMATRRARNALVLFLHVAWADVARVAIDKDGQVMRHVIHVTDAPLMRGRKS